MEWGVRRRKRRSISDVTKTWSQINGTLSLTHIIACMNDFKRIKRVSSESTEATCDSFMYVHKHAGVHRTVTQIMFQQHLDSTAPISIQEVLKYYWSTRYLQISASNFIYWQVNMLITANNTWHGLRHLTRATTPDVVVHVDCVSVSWNISFVP